MLGLLSLLRFAVGAFASYWLFKNLIAPYFAKHFQPITKNKAIIGSIIGGGIFFLAPPLWLILVAVVYAVYFLKP
ncbi:MAG: hypothetical protein WCK52_06245 [Betaproteobacteria bacterium]|jgi:hypothetical protein